MSVECVRVDKSFLSVLRGTLVTPTTSLFNSEMVILESWQKKLPQNTFISFFQVIVQRVVTVCRI